MVAEDQPEGGEGIDRPMARARILVGLEAAPSRAWRRPKRRKTSEMVTRIEMTMRTMMIHVWSICGISKVEMLITRLSK
jgi:hypothetical protein